MQLQNVTVKQTNGKNISNIMFVGDYFDLTEKVKTMQMQHAKHTVEGFTYAAGGGWTKMAPSKTTCEFKFGDVELWNEGRNWVVTEGRKRYIRPNERQARQVLCEILEGV
jgi:hypothetical protein